jgi:hypothetical protein
MIQKPKHRQLLCHSSYYASTNKHSDLKAISISVSGERRKWPHHSQIHLSVLMLNGCIVVTPRSISIFFWDSMTTWQLDPSNIQVRSMTFLWHQHHVSQLPFLGDPQRSSRRTTARSDVSPLESQGMAMAVGQAPCRWHRVDGTGGPKMGRFSHGFSHPC